MKGFWKALILIILSFFGKKRVKASTLDSSSFGFATIDAQAEVIDSVKKDQFLELARRNWSTEECLGAKIEFDNFLRSKDLRDLAEYPEHYFVLVDDQLLTEARARVDIVKSRIDAEILRRGK